MSTELGALGPHGTGQQEGANVPGRRAPNRPPRAQHSKARAVAAKCNTRPRVSAGQQVCQVRTACLPRKHVLCRGAYHSRHGCMTHTPMLAQSLALKPWAGCCWAVFFEPEAASFVSGPCRRSCEEKRRGCKGEARHALWLRSMRASSLRKRSREYAGERHIVQVGACRS